MSKDFQSLSQELFTKLSSLKDKGNNCFKQKQYSNALAYYYQMIKYVGLSPKAELQIINPKLYQYIIKNTQLNLKLNDMRVTALKNISAVHFKLKHWSQCIDKCDLILSYTPKDVKSLFRRAQSFKKLNKVSNALQDIQKAYQINPSKEMKKAMDNIQSLQNKNNNDDCKERIKINNDIKFTKVDADIYKKFGVKSSMLYNLVQIPFKGYGLIANCDITKGTVIIKEKPCFTVKGTANNSLQTALQKVKKDDMMIMQTLSHSITMTSKENIIDIIMDIMSNNCIAMNSKLKGLFGTICRINHSCIPNALWYWNEKEKYQYVVAITDIKKKEEITVNYISHKKYDTKLKRREHIIKTYGFYCECSLCNGTDQRSKKFDKINGEYQKLKDEYFDFSTLDIKDKNIESKIKKKLEENTKLIEINKKYFNGDFECGQLYAERMQICSHPLMRKFNDAYQSMLSSVKYFILNNGIPDNDKQMKYFEYLNETKLQQVIQKNLAKFPTDYQLKIKQFLKGKITRKAVLDL